MYKKFQLSGQLEYYTELDEQVRALLNRRARVKDLKFRTETGLKFSASTTKISPGRKEGNKFSPVRSRYSPEKYSPQRFL